MNLEPSVPMNLLRPQSPYRFMPPKYSPAFRPFLHLLTNLSLRYEFKVGEVLISGLEKLASLAREGHSVLVAPNHADHADPGLMVTAARKGGFAFHFMAAREGFERHRIHQWVLQKSGAFSINREGGDLASIKMAIKVLQEGRFPLVIFPEGEIYHHMESLDELNEGVASIAPAGIVEAAGGQAWIRCAGIDRFEARFRSRGFIFGSIERIGRTHYS